MIFPVRYRMFPAPSRVSGSPVYKARNSLKSSFAALILIFNQNDLGFDRTKGASKIV
jgi:hypothetical protein